MSDTFSELLNDKTVKSSPDIWFERVVLYRDMSKEPIQDIALKKGLNVIRAGDDFAREDISGHGTGKTTFCRMLRYLLGEPTYANKHDAQLIRELFKNGCIVAVLHIRGKKWAVRRPFDETSSFAIKDGTLEEVLATEKNGISRSQYVRALGLDSFCENLSFRDGRPIQWSHILSWMTRDQEARLSDIYTWRVLASESGAAPFLASKQDPLFLMRAVLGLLTPTELLNENELIRLERLKDKTEKDIAVLKSKPALHINDLEAELRNLLAKINALHSQFGIADNDAVKTLPWEPPTELLRTESLFFLSQEYQGKLSEKCLGLRGEYQDLQIELEKARVSLAGTDNQIRIHSAIISLSSDALREIENNRLLENANPSQTPSNDAEQRIETYLDKIEKIKQEFCDYGQIKVGTCTYFSNCVNNQIEAIKRNCSQVSASPSKQEVEKSITDRQTIEQNEAKAQREKQQSESRLAHLLSEQEQKRAAINELKNRRQTLEADINTNSVLLRDVQDTHRRIVNWREKLKYDPELVEAENTLERTVADLEKTNRHLFGLIETHQKNTHAMTMVFDRLVKSILSPSSYSGTAELTKERDLSFTIFYLNNPSVSIAINVLKTILADISSVLYASITDGTAFPRFLIHDSPREADLQRSHYDAIFSIFPLIQTLFDKAGGTPFQYIVTTTTTPMTPTSCPCLFSMLVIPQRCS